MKEDKITPEEPQAETKKKSRFRLFTSDDEELNDDNLDLNLRTIFGGDFMTGRWFRKNIFFIFIVICMLIFYISLRYTYDKETLRTKDLEDTLLDRRYKLLTISSQLKEHLRPSVIEDNLADTTLHVPTTPPYVLPIEPTE